MVRDLSIDEGYRRRTTWSIESPPLASEKRIGRLESESSESPTAIPSSVQTRSRWRIHEPNSEERPSHAELPV